MSEQETTIVINEEDLKEGWFSFGTSKEILAKKVHKRCEGYIKDERLSKNQEGKIVWWQFKLDRKCLKKPISLLKTPKEIGKKLTEEEKDMLQARLKGNGLKKTKEGEE